MYSLTAITLESGFMENSWIRILIYGCALGVSLAQDRGRLEARIEVLGAELETQKKQNERNFDALKIKTKIVDDQTETIRKLKEVDVQTVTPPPALFFAVFFFLHFISQKMSLLQHLPSKALQERDDRNRKVREEVAQAQKKLQQQLEEQTIQQAEQREQLDHLSLRKEELKQQLQDKHAELDEVKRAYR